MTGLRKYAQVDRTRRCEICRTALIGEHRHVVALDERELRCVCRPCGLLFDPAGAGGGRLRAVPERYLSGGPIADADWDRLHIPVLPVFLFENSDLDRVVACYPSPNGATESMLDLDGWAALRDGHPLLSLPVPDVEAIFVIRVETIEAYLVPIDVCFSVAGMVRLNWRGPDGGETVRRGMAELLADLRTKSRKAFTLKE
jgi:hypothetical protein